MRTREDRKMNAERVLKDLCEYDRRAVIVEALDRIGVRYFVDDYDGEAVNIVVEFGDPWTYKQVYGAHYDVVDSAPGANDNGAAVVSLLLLVERLHNENFHGPVCVVFWDNEEPPHRYNEEGENVSGSYLWSDTLLAENTPRPEFILVLDVTGFGERIIYSRPAPETMIETLKRNVADLGAMSTPGSDESIMASNGVDAILISTIPGEELNGRGHPDTWSLLHTPDDKFETVDPDNLGYIAELCWRITRELSGDSQPLLETKAPSDTKGRRKLVYGDEAQYDEFWGYPSDLNEGHDPWYLEYADAPDDPDVPSEESVEWEPLEWEDYEDEFSEKDRWLSDLWHRSEEE